MFTWFLMELCSRDERNGALLADGGAFVRTASRIIQHYRFDLLHCGYSALYYQCRLGVVSSWCLG